MTSTATRKAPLLMRVLTICTALALSFIVIFFPGTASAKRVALVIGNGNYERSPQLQNPENDAAAVAGKLETLGFEIWGGAPLINVNRDEMVDAIRTFSSSLEEGDLALFFFAGHGIQFRGENYLIPIDDGEITYRDDLPDYALGTDALMRRLRGREGVTSVVILDACRDNPLPVRVASRASSRGLAHMEAPAGAPTFIIFSTGKGQTASDGEGPNSTFTASLLRALDEGGRRIEDIMYQVRAEVRVLSAGAQVPWNDSSLEAPLFLATPVESGGTGSPISTTDRAAISWASIDLIGDPSARVIALHSHRERFPDSPFSHLIGDRIARLEREIEQPLAQDTGWEPEGTPYFGTVELSAGFLPDPYTAPLRAGGDQNAHTISSGCNGWIGSRPDFVVEYEAGDYPLYFAAVSDADTVLVIQSPGGDWSCNDDYTYLNPLVSVPEPASGTYRVWVGVYDPSAGLPPATLGISEVGFEF